MYIYRAYIKNSGLQCDAFCIYICMAYILCIAGEGA